ncbi:MAG: hypothetical protein AAF197_08595 [Pseudomonadota bacterium]
MWTGVEVLMQLDSTLQQVRRNTVGIDTKLARLSQSIGQSQHQRMGLIRDIARVRIKEIESGGLQSELTSADREVLQLLESRETAFTKLNTQIKASEVEVEAAEQNRAANLATVNAASEALVELEASVQEALKTDQAYLALVEQAARAENIATESLAKVERARESMAERAVPYKSDSLFMYLWDRGYGTTKYDAGLFARWLDGWVAKVVNYEPARVNYWNLTEIPRRLQNHADLVTQKADEALMAVQQLELDRLEEAGFGNQQSELETQRTILDEADDQLEQREQHLNELLAERVKFVGGEDNYIHQCLSRLTLALDHQDLDAVYRYVLTTASPTDDQLVLELSELDQRLAGYQADLKDLKRVHDRKLSRLRDIETVRQNFKNSRFDDVRSGFNNKSLLVASMAQFVQGELNGSELWQALERNQRYRKIRSNPEFGSGSVGDIFNGQRRTTRQRGRNNSSWHWPKPRRGAGGFKLPRAPRSSGGFKTGGSF